MIQALGICFVIFLYFLGKVLQNSSLEARYCADFYSCLGNEASLKVLKANDLH